MYSLGIAVVPKPQPHLYNSWFQEIFMRTLKENEEGYRKSAPINYAEGLEGDLLIITGTGETNTHVQIVGGIGGSLDCVGQKVRLFCISASRPRSLAGRGHDATLTKVYDAISPNTLARRTEVRAGHVKLFVTNLVCLSV